MITKLKYLKSLYYRDIQPKSGSLIGTIIYTSKLAVNNLYKQYIIDVDTNTVSKNLVDEDDEIVETVYEKISPINDKKLYIGENKKEYPVIKVDNKSFTFIKGENAGSIKVLSYVTYNGKSSGIDKVIAITDAPSVTGISIDKGTIVVNTNTAEAKKHIFKFKIASSAEPDIFQELTIEITINNK